MYGDPQEIRRLAAKVLTGADLTRADAGRGASADGVEWKSLAAESYRKQLVVALQHARAAAGQLDELADALLRHADAVQRRLDQIAAAERWLRAQAQQAEHDVVSLAGDVVDGVKNVVHASVGWVEHHPGVLLTDARQRADSLGRTVGQLPAGDLGWLDAARSHGWGS